jgi:5-methylcytosine-specific restriction endonuclease McrA
MLEAPFPFDFEGYGPRPEDSITRFGSTTVYYLANLDGLISLGLTILANWQDRPVLLAHHHPTNTGALIAAERADLTPTRLRLGMLTGLNGDAEQLRFESLPKDGESLVGSDGVNYKWISETIRDARPDDTTFTWTALVCVPVWAEHPGLLWSPSYLYLSERLSRINTNTNSHARRVRKEEGVVERFAAADIFERDNWTCQLCGEGIDIALKWPNPLSASLDHILPLSAEGDHTRENSQAAHLQCNMLKGARVNTF